MNATNSETNRACMSCCQQLHYVTRAFFCAEVKIDWSDYITLCIFNESQHRMKLVCVCVCVCVCVRACVHVYTGGVCTLV